MIDRFTSWLAQVRAFCAPAWEIREAAFAGDVYFHIYRRQFGRERFAERLVSLRGAACRLAELQGVAPRGENVLVGGEPRAIPQDTPEASASSPEGRMYRGSRAREVLENESFDWAFHTLKTEIIESWQHAPAQDPQGRETLWLSLKLLEKVRSNLVNRLETGKVARLELEHQKTLERQERAWAQ